MGQEPGFRTSLVIHEAKADRAMYRILVPVHTPPRVHHLPAPSAVYSRACHRGHGLVAKECYGLIMDSEPSQDGPILTSR